MKLLLFFIFNLMFCSTQASQLPLDWVSSNEFNSSKGLNSWFLNRTANKINEILVTQGEVLESVEKNSRDKIRLVRYDSFFSVNKRGVLGLSSVSSSKAVEFRWTPVKEDKAIERVNFVVDTTLDSNKIEDQANNLTNKIFSSKKIKDKKILHKNLLAFFTKTNAMMSKISVFQSRMWLLEGMAADLEIGADASLGTSFGGEVAMRVRVEWKYNPIIASHSVNNQSNEFVGGVLTELDKLPKSEINGYSLEKIRMAVGMSYDKGIIGIAGVGATQIGRLYFKRKKKIINTSFLDIELGIKNDIKKIDTKNDSPIAIYESSGQADNRNLNVKFMSRRRWQKGLRKIFKISDFFIHRVPVKKRSWEVSSINTSFAITQKGWFGLIGPRKHAQIEFRFFKRSNLTDYHIVNPVHELLMLDQVRFRTRLIGFYQIPLVLKLSSLSEVELYWGAR